MYICTHNNLNCVSTSFVCISHKVDDVSNVLNQLEAVDDIKAQALQVCINVAIYGHCYYICTILPAGQ